MWKWVWRGIELRHRGAHFLRESKKVSLQLSVCDAYFLSVFMVPRLLNAAGKTPKKKQKVFQHVAAGSEGTTLILTLANSQIKHYYRRCTLARTNAGDHLTALNIWYPAFPSPSIDSPLPPFCERLRVPWSGVSISKEPLWGPPMISLRAPPPHIRK